jgi:hypothetical protein
LVYNGDFDANYAPGGIPNGWSLNTDPTAGVNAWASHDYNFETPPWNPIWSPTNSEYFDIRLVCLRKCYAGGSNSITQQINGLVNGNQYKLKFWAGTIREASPPAYYEPSLPISIKIGTKIISSVAGQYSKNTSDQHLLRSETVNFTYLESATSALLSFIQNFKPFDLVTCVPCTDTLLLAHISLEDVTPAAPKLTVTKALNGNRGTNTDQFQVQILDGVKVVNSTTNSTTTGSGLTVDNGTGTTGPTTLVAGTSYMITEAGSGATNLGGYSSTLACINSTGTKVPTALNTAFTLSNTDTVSCTITNKALPATLALRQLVLRPVPINIVAPYTFSYTGNNGWTTQPVTNVSEGTLASGPTQTLSAFNTATTLSAIMPDRWSVSTFSCADINAAVSGNPTGTLVIVNKVNTLTIPAANVRPGANLRCTSMLSRLTP